MKILQAGVEHVALVAPLFDAYRQFYKQPSDLPGATAFLTERLRNGQSFVLLALDDAGVGLGFVQLYPSFSSVRMKPILILNDLFVAGEARRGGVGRGLMNAALELARSTGAARLALSTAKDNHTARALYLSLGYQIDEEFDHLELRVQ
jgi:GNAT superfamily N-acetyltransferase